MQPEIDKGTPYSVAFQMYEQSHGSMLYQIPPRPVIEPAIENSKFDLADLLAQSAQDAAEGNDTDQSLTAVGMQAVEEVQNWFDNPKNGWAPNSPVTVKAKGSSQPLVDTGALRQAITFGIRGDEK